MLECQRSELQHRRRYRCIVCWIKYFIVLSPHRIHGMVALKASRWMWSRSEWRYTYMTVTGSRKKRQVSRRVYDYVHSWLSGWQLMDKAVSVCSCRIQNETGDYYKVVKYSNKTSTRSIKDSIKFSSSRRGDVIDEIIR